MRQPMTTIPVNGHQCDSITRSVTWFYRKLKRSKAEEYPDLRENRTHKKTLQIRKFSDSKFLLKIPDPKISGDMTKPGSFYFVFVHLCVNS